MTEAHLDPTIEFNIVNSLGWPSLRPLQQAAIGPVRSGADCILLAPTAGGKTEASVFPLLSEMQSQEWRGVSVLYVAPLRALLNNLLPRISQYGAWVGRTVALWHGDTGDSERRRILDDRPDILLTTPESLESMLVSRRVDHRMFFADVRAIVIDEVHAFAASDRGWHLLAVLERLQRLAGERIQRIGLSATVGNPVEMGTWLQGSNAALGDPPLVVTEQAPPGAAAPEITLDYVGTLENAAEVISRLHRGEKRLVFCPKREYVEKLTYELRERGVTAFASHSSLSKDERAVSERAFAEATDCVIVATSTLELGVDIGDLDRVIQIDSTYTVSSFLQRMGRTGRRPGTSRNTLILTIDDRSLLLAAGILTLWSRGWVEPVTAPPHPRHLAAQQLLALALQEGAFWEDTWAEWWSGCDVMTDAPEVLAYLRAEGFLVSDGARLFLGEKAERTFGRRHFMELLSSFLSSAEVRVVADRREVGSIAPIAIRRDVADGLAPLLLAGRGWRVLEVDWDRFVARVEPWPDDGKVKWPGSGLSLSFEVMRAEREVLLGTNPPVELTRRAHRKLEALREERAEHVSASGLVRQGGRLWTWAGQKANATLLASMGDPEDATAENEYLEGPTLPESLRSLDVSDAVPYISPDAVEAMKFNEALPLELARNTLAERFADREGAAAVTQGDS